MSVSRVEAPEAAGHVANSPQGLLHVAMGPYPTHQGPPGVPGVQWASYGAGLRAQTGGFQGMSAGGGSDGALRCLVPLLPRCPVLLWLQGSALHCECCLSAVSHLKRLGKSAMELSYNVEIIQFLSDLPQA